MGFGPSDTVKNEVLEPLVNDLRNMARGVKMRIAGQVFLVHVKVLYGVADMVAANVLAGIKAPTASRPCRECDAKREDFGPHEFSKNSDDLVRSLRQPHLTADQRRHGNSILTLGARGAFYSSVGLKKTEPILGSRRSFAFNVHHQIGHDAPHAEQKGMSLVVLDGLMASLSERGLEKFTQYFRDFEFPPDCSR